MKNRGALYTVATLERGLKGSSDSPQVCGGTDKKFKSPKKATGTYNEAVLIKVWSSLLLSKPHLSCEVVQQVVRTVVSLPGRQVPMVGTRGPAFPCPHNRIP